MPTLAAIPHQTLTNCSVRPSNFANKPIDVFSGEQKGSKIDITRIEKESEEISRRIQQLKQKDHKVVSVDIDYY